MPFRRTQRRPIDNGSSFGIAIASRGPEAPAGLYVRTQNDLADSMSCGLSARVCSGLHRASSAVDGTQTQIEASLGAMGTAIPSMRAPEGQADNDGETDHHEEPTNGVRRQDDMSVSRFVVS